MPPAYAVPASTGNTFGCVCGFYQGVIDEQNSEECFLNYVKIREVILMYVNYLSIDSRAELNLVLEYYI